MDVIQRYKQAVYYNAIQQERERNINPNAFRALSHYLLETEEVTYDSYVSLKQSMPLSQQKYFTSKLFMDLANSKPANRKQLGKKSLSVSSEVLVKYLDQCLEQERITLELFEFTLMNEFPQYITNEQLQAYIQLKINEVDPGQMMVESFYEFYTCIAVQRFLFYLDSRNSDSISITELVQSEIMNEFIDVIQLQQELVQYQLRNPHHDDQYPDEREEALRNKIDSNWFSPTNAVNIYTSFLNLDMDQNGLLNLEEIRAFQGFAADALHFTPAAWRRIFEELIVFAPFELDFRGFVKLVLALDDIHLAVDEEKNLDANNTTNGSSSSSYKNKRGYHGLKFFWQVLDFNRSGHISPMKIQLFYDDIISYMTAIEQYIPTYEIMLYEIFDMVSYHPTNKPQNNNKENTSNNIRSSMSEKFQQQKHHGELSGQRGPTFLQVIQSQKAATLFLMLLDINSFWRYENRENGGAPPTPPIPPNYPFNNNNNSNNQIQPSNQSNSSNNGGILQFDENYDDDEDFQHHIIVPTIINNNNSDKDKLQDFDDDEDDLQQPSVYEEDTNDHSNENTFSSLTNNFNKKFSNSTSGMNQAHSKLQSVKSKVLDKLIYDDEVEDEYNF